MPVPHLQPLPQSRRPLQRLCRSCVRRRAVKDEAAVTFVLHHHSPPLVSLRSQPVGVRCRRRSPPQRGCWGVPCVSQPMYVWVCVSWLGIERTVVTTMRWWLLLQQVATAVDCRRGVACRRRHHRKILMGAFFFVLSSREWVFLVLLDIGGCACWPETTMAANHGGCHRFCRRRPPQGGCVCVYVV